MNAHNSVILSAQFPSWIVSVLHVCLPLLEVATLTAVVTNDELYNDWMPMMEDPVKLSIEEKLNGDDFPNRIR